jgi:hypothetical protein
MSESEQSGNGREHERMPINVVAEVSCDSMTPCTYQVTDLSKTGAHLLKSDPGMANPEVGKRIHLKLSWPMDPQTPPLKVDADVMRSDDEGIGIQFVY